MEATGLTTTTTSTIITKANIAIPETPKNNKRRKKKKKTKPSTTGGLMSCSFYNWKNNPNAEFDDERTNQLTLQYFVIRERLRYHLRMITPLDIHDRIAAGKSTRDWTATLTEERSKPETLAL